MINEITCQCLCYSDRVVKKETYVGGMYNEHDGCKGNNFFYF